MARIIGGLGTSHVPSIGVALDKGLDATPEWKPFFDGYQPARDWVAKQRPDVAVVVFNDHYNALFLDRVPTFAVGCAGEYLPADEGWGPRPIPPFQGAPDFSWHLVDTLVENWFDPEVIQEIKVDHGLQVPMELFWGRPEDAWPVRVVPIFVNVLQYPVPLPSRLYHLGKTLRKAIESYDSDERFVVLGTGGLSHQLQGARGLPQPRGGPALPRGHRDGPRPARRVESREVRRDVRRRGRRAHHVARDARSAEPGGAGASPALLRSCLHDRRRDGAARGAGDVPGRPGRRLSSRGRPLLRMPPGFHPAVLDPFRCPEASGRRRTSSSGG